MAKHTFKELLSPYRHKLVGIVLVNLLSVFFAIVTMMLLEPFVMLVFQGHLNNLSPVTAKLMEVSSRLVDLSNPANSLLVIVLYFIVLFLLKDLFYFWGQWLLAPVRADVVRRLRDRLYHKVLILPLSFFSEQKKGDVISRAVNDTQEIEFTVLKSFQQLLTEPLTVLLYLVTLLALSWQLTLFVLVLLPLAGLVIARISKSLRKQSKNAKGRLGALLAHVEESLSGLRIIKGFNAQKHAETVFDKHNSDFTGRQKKIYRRVDLASPVSEFLGVTVVMIVLVFGGMMVLDSSSSLTAPLFIAYIGLFTQVINPAKNISTAVSNYRRGLAALDRIYEIIDAEEIIEEAPQAQRVSEFHRDIEIDDVSFAYESAEVLKNISLTIHKGEMVALVGQSGSGKSTLADLLPRFYDVTTGRILIDGTDIRQFRIDDLRSLFAYVSQDIILFNDTIANNIAFGAPAATREQIENATKVANAYDFIMELPEGFDTPIGDRGLNLSGGQRQRISIARAVLRNAPIIILDEATSAMDTESEKQVQQALDSVMENRTSLVIAHRLSTIRHADRIVVMHDGVILESGTHDELMQLGGRYYNLIQIQNQ
ncbi:MAG: ABC transporter ATP-binding protein [Bacteroidales bacterium]|nr:ABC transporter ATP-binding protein [Bacteroidales bacterium]